MTTSDPTNAHLNPLSLADDITLTESLRFAVPLHLADLLARPPVRRESTARWWAKEAATVVGSGGDQLMFVKPDPSARTRKTVANTFDHLARGLAAAVVLNPPGVTFAGLHWCLQDGCEACRPPQAAPAFTVAELNAQLEAIDADYRKLAGMPPYEHPAAAGSARIPTARRPRGVTDVHLLEVA